MRTQEDVHVFLGGKGKGKHSNTSGKGFGRTGNPKDRHGVTMTCHGCGSETHLIAKCPKGKGKGSPSTFGGVAWQVTPLDTTWAGESQLAATSFEVPTFTPAESSPPPWGDSDLLFDAPQVEYIGGFGSYPVISGADPSATDDPGGGFTRESQSAEPRLQDPFQQPGGWRFSPTC